MAMQGVAIVGFDKENNVNQNINHTRELKQVQSTKLRSILADFDQQVEMTCAKMEDELNQLVGDLRDQLLIETMKLPEGIREMPMREFIAKYGADVNQLYDVNLKRIFAELHIDKLRP